MFIEDAGRCDFFMRGCFPKCVCAVYMCVHACVQTCVY